MAQRNSEYARMAGDLYVTPRWVYEALYSVEPWAAKAWDCAPINAEFNFLESVGPIEAIATNPPFNQAVAFCRKSIEVADKVAMLLPHAFDTAKGRVDLWGPPFKVKYTLTRRIRWENLVQMKAGPSMNHAWFVWDSSYAGKPSLGYL